MKYKLQNIHIFTGKNSRGDYAWLQADLFNEIDPFNNPNPTPRYYSMTPAVIALYDKFKEPTKDDKGILIPNDFTVNEASVLEAINSTDPTTKIPDILHIDHVFRYTYALEGSWIRKYRTDVTDADGHILHKAGEPIIANGASAPVPVTSIPLYLKKGMDSDTGEWDWVDAPEIVARRVLERSYMPAEPTQTPMPTTTVAEPTQKVDKDEQIKAMQAQIDALKQAGLA